MKVFDALDPTLVLADFFAYDPAFTGGVHVAGSRFVDESAGRVPEPGTLGMLVLGFAGLGLLSRRRC